MSDAYSELFERLGEAATLYSVGGLLGWDQETMMPERGAAFRARELALLGRIAHERVTHPRVGELLSQCEADAQVMSDRDAAANVRELRRDYDRARKIPADLVAEMNETSSLALQAWKEAREQSDFSKFEPWLEKQLGLARRKAECYGVPDGGEQYDALLEDYEPGMTSAEIERLFGPLRESLTPLIAEIAAADYRPSDAPHRAKISIDKQKEFNLFVLKRLGFDMGAGRFDVSVHPFSSGVAPGDTRITTRYREDHFADALGSTMHEAGHGLYEQGLPKAERWGQPLCEPVGLGIHESQSRMWENQVGRSRAFWTWALPEAQRMLGDALSDCTVDSMYEAANIVEPHLIRVESDEATYNLHIMLRFDLERALLRGDLPVADLPGAWNERIKRDLGLDVPSHALGCLQDIHWAMGSIGYLPTYTLGNLFSAQFFEAVQRALPNLDADMTRGEFGGLLQWLRENIHARGRRDSADALCSELSGEPLSHHALMRHLDGKLRPVYRL
ncbi:MAG: carboxypeptidase M32 [bacterium]|nr:carboxypeptidase M32 [bacterium]